jgi:hypothetical protein
MSSTEEQTAHEPKTVTIIVNGHDVTLAERRASGLSIKTAAIAAGVPIESDFVLYRKHGHDLDKVDDEQVIDLHPREEFTCVAPDDVA